MREISQALRTVLFSSSDWTATLVDQLETLKNDMQNPACSAAAFEVAQLFEHCVADRAAAISGFVLCYRSNTARLDALNRAFQVCQEVGDFGSKARLARMHYKHDSNPAHLIAEGIAWLDAGQPDRAIKPLVAADRALPDRPDVESALRTARREWPTIKEEVARLMAHAHSAGTAEEAADALLQAARMLRMLKTHQDSLEGLILASLKEDPENLSSLSMLENHLAHLTNKDAVIGIYEQRLANRTAVDDQIEELRRSGMSFFGSGSFQALAVRLLERALKTAYAAERAHIPGHVAMLRVLRKHYEEADNYPKFLELVDLGLTLALPTLDLLFLSLQGLEVTFKKLEEREGSNTYAALANKLAPNHPLVIEARAAGLVGPEELAFAETSVSETEGSLGFLDSFEREAPPLIVGTAATLADQFKAVTDAQNTADDSATESPDLVELPISGAEDAPEFIEHLDAPTAEPLDLVELPNASATEALEMVELPASATDADALDLVELPASTADALDLVELPASAADEGIDLVEPEPNPKPHKTNVEPTASAKPIPKRIDSKAPETTGTPTPPKATLAKISLIPQSAISALKRSSMQRSKTPALAKGRAARLAMPVSIEFSVDNEPRTALTRDLCETGAFLITALNLSKGLTLNLAIRMPISVDSMGSDTMHLEAKVVRESGTGYGVLFPSPPEEFKTRIKELIAQQ